MSLAYFLGPLLGGEVSQYIGFSWLMSIIGLANIVYAIYLIRTVLFVYQSEVCFFYLFLFVSIFFQKQSFLVKKRLWLFLNHRIFFVYACSTQGYIASESTEINNRFFLRLWPSNTTLSSASSYKRFYDTMDKPQQP